MIFYAPQEDCVRKVSIEVVEGGSQIGPSSVEPDPFERSVCYRSAPLFFTLVKDENAEEHRAALHN